MNRTKIEWADTVWNPVTGCTKVSEGCRNCYAERMSKRLTGRCGYPADEPFRVTLHPEKLDEPLKWKKLKRRVFVNSMSDLFHDDVPDFRLDEIFGVMLACRILINIPDHIFMILTKRPQRMHRYFTERKPNELIEAWAKASNWITLDDADILFEELNFSEINRDWLLSNLWLGVSVENQQAADERIPVLLETPAAVRFISCEPLLGPLEIRKYLGMYQEADEVTVRCMPDGESFKRSGRGWVRHDGVKLDWVIAGGETGLKARPMHPDWVRNLRDQCQRAGVPFFFKSWGEFSQVGECMNESDDNKFYNMHNVRRVNYEGGMGYHGSGAIYMQRVGKKKSGNVLDGRIFQEFPD